MQRPSVARQEWGYWLNRLHITDTSVLSVLTDGARWIGDSSLLEFHGKAQENLDIYHALDSRKDVLRVLENYLVDHRNRMNYRERLAAGKSIGSGQVEGACKNLVGRRLKQTGACWDFDRVNRMGVLCAVLYGDQWNAYWKTAG